MRGPPEAPSPTRFQHLGKGILRYLTCALLVVACGSDLGSGSDAVEDSDSRPEVAGASTQANLLPLAETIVRADGDLCEALGLSPLLTSIAAEVSGYAFSEFPNELVSGVWRFDPDEVNCSWGVGGTPIFAVAMHLGPDRYEALESVVDTYKHPSIDCADGGVSSLLQFPVDGTVCATYMVLYDIPFQLEVAQNTQHSEFVYIPELEMINARAALELFAGMLPGALEKAPARLKCYSNAANGSSENMACLDGLD